MTVLGDSLGSDGTSPSRPPGLLAQLLDNEVDPDYRAAAAARGSGRRSTTSGLSWIRMLAAVAAFGVLLGVSAAKTQHDQPFARAERDRLIAAVNARQHTLDTLHATLRTQQVDIADLQTRLAATASADTRVVQFASTLGRETGAEPVRGPGLVVTVDDAAQAVPGAGGVIRDTDLQALVNGLWAAGAEAIAVNGHRLTTLTAIRFAGRAITVDYRSLTPPYVVEAVGNPNTLPARFLQTQGGQTWLGLRANFGIRFATRTSNRIELPGDPRHALLWAHQAVIR
jgi:uncharacterized protein YlxW (UPF0749 family)